MRCIEVSSNIRKTREKKRDEMRRGLNYQVELWSNLPMTLDTRCGRVGSERRIFLLDRFRRLRLFFNEHDEEPLFCGFPVPVGTAGDITLVLDFGLRVLEGERLVLVPLLLPPPEETRVAMGPPGKV